MLTTAAKVTAYSSSTHSPYKFSPGVLQSLFGGVVQSWFDQLAAAHAAHLAAVFANQSFFAVSVVVPSRFILSLGLPFPSGDFAAALGTAFGVTPSHFFDFSVCM